MTYSNIIVDRNEAVGLITLNRPSALNALNNELIAELNQALDAIDADDSIGATVLTGSDKAFAAGADVKQMAELSFSTAYDSDFIGPWSRIANKRKPIIAAVAGYALGGGCELAMMCDIIIAADNAKFGQPEINLATIPGAGGTQRLIRVVGKAKAMDMILTGRMMDAAEAERSGLVTRVVPVSELIPEAIKMAGVIASKSSPVVRMAKDAVKAAFETTLAEGLRYERQSFYASFATEDRTEGMKAFIDKRPAKFRNR